MAESSRVPAVWPGQVGPRRHLGLALRFGLAAAGLALFTYLVAVSGVSLPQLQRLGWKSAVLLLAISSGVILVDTLAWAYAMRSVVRPPLHRLVGLRIAGDALTNAVPGGVALGEAYKALQLKAGYAVSWTEITVALVGVKFGLALSQALFVLAGLLLVYPLLRDRSHELFGFGGAQHLALGITLATGLALVLFLSLLHRGGSISGLAALAGRLPVPRVRSWLGREQARIALLEQQLAPALHGHRTYFAHTLGYLMLGWLLGVAETWVLLDRLGLDPTLDMAFAIESVGSLFRLVFFMAPSGIGGQDASFFALFRLYGLPEAAIGTFIVAKRLKELAWIGAGFALIAHFRSRMGVG
ncbi:MAG: lysylphosphatidylglycerol synthase domain-containing protein [Pseudomonadota bacterium]|nr:lysylphosphatidylglycerol synthase domain-containing protein [Pseudomonadota bacterium]